MDGTAEARSSSDPGARTAFALPEAGGAMPAAITQFGDPMALDNQGDLSLANIRKWHLRPRGT